MTTARDLDAMENMMHQFEDYVESQEATLVVKETTLNAIEADYEKQQTARRSMNEQIGECSLAWGPSELWLCITSTVCCSQIVPLTS